MEMEMSLVASCRRDKVTDKRYLYAFATCVHLSIRGRRVILARPSVYLFIKPRSYIWLSGVLLCLRSFFVVLSVTNPKPPRMVSSSANEGHFSALFVISPLRKVLYS